MTEVGRGWSHNQSPVSSPPAPKQIHSSSQETSPEILHMDTRQLGTQPQLLPCHGLPPPLRSDEFLIMFRNYIFYSQHNKILSLCFEQFIYLKRKF